jgi:hypothetical protein
VTVNRATDTRWGSGSGRGGRRFQGLQVKEEDLVLGEEDDGERWGSIGGRSVWILESTEAEDERQRGSRVTRRLMGGVRARELDDTLDGERVTVRGVVVHKQVTQAEPILRGRRAGLKQ